MVLAFSAQVSSAKRSLGQDLGGSGAFCKTCQGKGGLLTSVQLTGAALLMCWGLAQILTEGCEREGERWGVITVLNQVRNNGLLCKSSSAQRGVFKDISAFVPRGMSFMVN